MTAMSIMVVTMIGISATITRKRKTIISGTAGKTGLGITIGKTNTIRILIGIARTSASGNHTGTGDTAIRTPFFSTSIFASDQKALNAACSFS